MALLLAIRLPCMALDVYALMHAPMDAASYVMCCYQIHAQLWFCEGACFVSSGATGYCMLGALLLLLSKPLCQHPC